MAPRAKDGEGRGRRAGARTHFGRLRRRVSAGGPGIIGVAFVVVVVVVLVAPVRVDLGDDVVDVGVHGCAGAGHVGRVCARDGWRVDVQVGDDLPYMEGRRCTSAHPRLWPRTMVRTVGKLHGTGYRVKRGQGRAIPRRDSNVSAPASRIYA